MIERERYSRRSILRAGIAIPAAAATTMLIPEGFIRTDSQIKDFPVNIIAHNAALSSQTLELALASKAPHIEMDITFDGTLVVAHSPEEYRALTTDQREAQNPSAILKRIINAGHSPFFDFKDEITDYEMIHAFIRSAGNQKRSMASSNNHKLLMDLKRAGFEGGILFSLGSLGALQEFLRDTQGTMSQGKYGVSIRHNLLRQTGIPGEIKKRGLTIAAWNPTSEGEIVQACINGADFITSDNFYNLAESVYSIKSA